MPKGRKFKTLVKESETPAPIGYKIVSDPVKGLVSVPAAPFEHSVKVSKPYVPFVVQMYPSYFPQNVKAEQPVVLPRPVLSEQAQLMFGTPYWA